MNQPICPKCKTAYPTGLLHCPACNATLTGRRKDAVDAGEELVVLLRTADIALLAVVKSLLDSSDIPYAVQGEEGLRTFPLGMASGFFNPTAFAAVICVRRSDLEDARNLLEASNARSENGNE